MGAQFIPGLAMEGPPCAGCKHWNPQPKPRHTDEGYVFDGHRLCHAADMFADFSCYVMNASIEGRAE